MWEIFEGTSPDETLFTIIPFFLLIQSLSLSDPMFTMRDVSGDWRFKLLFGFSVSICQVCCLYYSVGFTGQDLCKILMFHGTASLVEILLCQDFALRVCKLFLACTFKLLIVMKSCSPKQLFFIKIKKKSVLPMKSQKRTKQKNSVQRRVNRN